MADEQDQPWRIPPIVQELAAGVREPPSRYVIREKDRPIAGAPMPEPIPIVDLSRLSAPSEDHGVSDEAAKLRSALQNWGLFLAVGHGIEPGLLAEMMKVSRGFFDLPLAEKQKHSNLVSGKEFRLQGYGGDMVVAEDQVLDWCDRLCLVVEPVSGRVHSLWPTQPPSFSEVLSKYTVKCREVAGVVFGNMAKLLGLPEGYFVDAMGEESTTYAKLNYYPRCTKPEHVLGLKPHSDGSLLTVIVVDDDDVGGLQVQGDAGVWYDVPVVPGALLVNAGDTLEIMSNGFFKSPVHRVVTNAERERVSLAMFYALDLEKEIEPAPELVGEEQPRRYGKVKTKDYVAQLLETYARGIRTIDTLKI